MAGRILSFIWRQNCGGQLTGRRNISSDGRSRFQASASYFEDRCGWAHLSEINWEAVQTRDWRRHKDGKQAEFLIEQQFPWKLVSRIGVRSPQVSRQTLSAIEAGVHQPPIDIKPEWYY